MALGRLSFLFLLIFAVVRGFRLTFPSYVLTPRPVTILRGMKVLHASKKLKLEDRLSLGAPSQKPSDNYFVTDSNIKVLTEVTPVLNYEAEVQQLIKSLDNTHGVLLSSSYEYPGRYARWTVGFKAPPLKIIGKGYDFQIIALNDRGKQLLSMIHQRLPKSSSYVINENYLPHTLTGHILPASSENQILFTEEERSKQPSLFSILRDINRLFFSFEAGQLGLYGAFGYDLTFQFEPIALKKPRATDQSDLILFLPDEILVVDNQKKDAWKISYEFIDGLQPGVSTIGLERKAIPSLYSQTSSSLVASQASSFQQRDTPPGEYANWVQRAKKEFQQGNLFEVVLSQIFRERLASRDLPSTIFQRLSKRNPSPYGFFMNLGSNEYLIGASPEMFVRVERTGLGLRIETCPISGTIERGQDPLEDALQIKKLLANPKEESELTMCTDVDRNDKSRICESGSVKVLGRRQIEIYSRLIHTVDHVEGILRKEYDALDAFLGHTWAVTVTGAPKTWAMRFIEQLEPSPRIWYGGAVGIIGFDGSLNTGLTLRTIRVKDGIAEVRAGATLLYDSDPVLEEKETELKASAMIDAILRPSSSSSSSSSSSLGSEEDPEAAVDREDNNSSRLPATGSRDNKNKKKTVLLIDHEDSFVHTLANYLRQTTDTTEAARVLTCRSGAAFQQFYEKSILTGEDIPALVVLSPGPGRPRDFQLHRTIQQLIDAKIPIFGVCLGLQGLVEYFGGSLEVLEVSMHGKASLIHRLPLQTSTTNNTTTPISSRDILSDLPISFTVARYHSLYGSSQNFPSEQLAITAQTEEEGVIMAIQHRVLPIAAVQFHPESILTLPKYGLKILANALSFLTPELYPSSNTTTSSGKGRDGHTRE